MTNPVEHLPADLRDVFIRFTKELNFREKSRETFQLKRYRLNNLNSQIKSGRTRVLLSTVLWYYKSVNEDLQTEYEGQDPHVLSDHGLCKVLERLYGFDVQAMKDQALERIEEVEHLLHVVKRNGKIITVIPKEVD